ncbi:abortive infection family protein [Amycolatopsis sp. NBC_00438]|uniref:abortive infection family protein n=1 Tax=Amycolatopsis sp. NBC_00438 TaxID=2903558 RepID=UPI003FA4B245
MRLHPSAVQPGPDGADALKNILGGVSVIAIGLAELRNRGYCTGHGQARAPGRARRTPRTAHGQRRDHLVSAAAEHPRRAGRGAGHAGRCQQDLSAAR